MMPLFLSSFYFNKPVSKAAKFNRWKLFAAALLFAWMACAASASAQTAQWVKQMGTGGISNGVSSDAVGNAYATGIIGNPGLFDNLTIPCFVSDVFLAKYDTAGNIIWVNVGGGELLDQANDVATDANGNSYVVGAIQTNGPNPTAQFGSFTLTGSARGFHWRSTRFANRCVRRRILQYRAPPRSR